MSYKTIVEARFNAWRNSPEGRQSPASYAQEEER